MKNSLISVLFILFQLCSFTFCWSNKNYDFQAKRKQGEVELEALLLEGEEKCINKRCVQSEQCCPGSVCVHVDGATGNCLPIYGLNEGESCETDDDCESGLRCLGNSADDSSKESRACQPPGKDMVKKQYYEDCMMSSECDSSNGLCCQLIKRHRMAQRKMCFYFSDPKSCIGPVDVTFAKQHPVSIPHTNSFFKARIG